MKIVHITNFYSPKSGGIKTTMQELGARYQSLGHEFIYVIPGIRYSVDATACGLQISLPSLPIPFSGGYRVIRSNRSVKRLLMTLRPHRIEVSDRLTLCGIGKWANRRKISTVVFSHESLAALVDRFFRLKSLQNLVNWHNRRLARSFDWVIASTDFAAREFEKINTPNLRKIALGVDLEIFQPLRRDEELRRNLLAGDEILIVHCGRLSIEKNPDVSLNTLIELRKRGVKARLVFIGMGPLFNRLKKRSAGHPVTFLGYILGPIKVATILASADVVIAPGPHETFCLAALEALACGTPVVASSKSAVGELLSDKAGLPTGRVCSDEITVWADATVELARQPGLRSRCRSQAERFSWNNTIKELLNTNLPESCKKLDAA
jgi:alpha-1,6-mannosyltransferase